MYYLYEDLTSPIKLVFTNRDRLEDYVFSLHSEILPASSLLVNEETFSHSDFEITTSRFNKGDIVIDRMGNIYTVQDYIHSSLTQEFKIKLIRFNDSGSLPIYAEDIYFNKVEKITPIDDVSTCGTHNPDCKIVLSHTGCGNNKGDEFYYCRTHKLEVK